MITAMNHTDRGMTLSVQQQGQQQQEQQRTTQSKTTAAEKNHPPEATLPSSPFQKVIQEWHVVLGDTQSGGRRGKTTRATDILRQVKQECKAAHAGKPKKTWIPAARRMFAHRVKQEFANQTAAADYSDDIGLVLVKCTDKALQSGRVERAFTHGYAGDVQATYGTAKLPAALDFFFYSRDAPSLKRDLQTHANNLAALCQQYSHSAVPPALQDFEDTLHFFQSKWTQAEQGNPMAKRLLEDLCPLTALKEQWNLLQQQLPAIHDENEEGKQSSIEEEHQDASIHTSTTPLNHIRDAALEKELVPYLTEFLKPAVCCLCQHKAVGPWAHFQDGMFQIVDSENCCAQGTMSDHDDDPIAATRRIPSIAGSLDLPADLFMEPVDSIEDTLKQQEKTLIDCYFPKEKEEVAGVKLVRTSAKHQGDEKDAWDVSFLDCDCSSILTEDVQQQQLHNFGGKSVEPQAPQITLWSFLQCCQWDAARIHARTVPLDVNFVPGIHDCHNEQDERIGLTTLHVACQNTAPMDVIRRLLQLNPGAVSCRNANGATPLHLHLAADSVETPGLPTLRSPAFLPILDMLLNPTVAGTHYRSVGSPLHLFCRYGHADPMKEIGAFRRLLLADKSQVSRQDPDGNFPCDLLWQLYMQRQAMYEAKPLAVHKPAPQILRVLLLFLEDVVESDNLHGLIRFQDSCEWLQSIDFVRLYQEACSEDAAAAA